MTMTGHTHPQSATAPSREGSLLNFFRSIKGKMFLVFALTFLSAGLLTALNLWTMDTVKSRLLMGERYEYLLENILEVRRFEKNFLLYGDGASIEEGNSYLKRVGELVAELAPDIADVAGQQGLQSFQEALRAYEASVRSFAAGTRPNREEVRSRGKALVDFAQKIIQTKRTRIHRTLAQASVLPFAYLGVFLLLMVVIIKLISRGMLRPLDVIRVTTERVARGDFSPIPPSPGQLGEIAGLVGAFNRMAHELEANQEDLLQARKIAALGTFTAGIAHELNNPLNNISLTGEAFMEVHGEELDADGAEMIDDIMAQAERASEIVKNLLDFSRTEHPTFSPLAPEDIARSTVALVRNQVMLSGVRLEMQIPDGLPAIMGDLRTLQQVFMNLLLNAMQATPPEGVISLRAANAPGDFVRFEVRDTGSGIPQGALQHIFEPFFTTKEVGRGTGLGLAVTYAIIKRHNGRIDVKSEPGQGSVFSVYLPKATAQDKDQSP